MILNLIKRNSRKIQKMRDIFASSLLFVLIFSFIFSTLFVSQTEAVFNKQINYQGKLTTSANIAVPNGTYNMEFKLYTVPSAGTAIWTETRTNAYKVQVTNGLFSVMLGEVTALTSVDFNQTLYLGINIGGTGTPGWDGEMAPRKMLGAVPAAVVSENANITNDTATSSPVFPTWVTTNSGGMPIKTSSTLLSFIPSTAALTVTGSLNSPTFQGNAGAVTFGNASYNTTINGLVTSINSAAASALNITSGTTGALTLDSGTTGTINIGTNVNAKIITIGNANDDTFSLNSSGLDISSAGALSGITTLGMSGQLTSTLATGTAPFVVASTTAVANLNADFLDGNHASAFQLALTNPVTGTGTLNYIPKFTATGSTIGNSQIFDNGTNVGIGTATPRSILDVGSSVTTPAAGADYAALTLGSNFSNRAAQIAAYRQGGASDYDYVGLDFRVHPSAVDTDPFVSGMVIQYNGNVGIGTTSPGEKLDIQGQAIKIGGDIGSYNLRTDVTNKAGFFITPHYTNAQASVTGIYQSSTASASAVNFGGGSSTYNAATQLAFYTAANNTTVTGTERMRIDSAGNVGIGMTGPAHPLDVVGNIHSSTNLLVGAGSAGVTTSNTTDVKVIDGAGNTAFRGVRATTGWSDAVAAQWFQIGNSTDNVVFTTQSGTRANRVLFNTAAFHIVNGVGSSAPVGLFDVSSTTGKLFNILGTGNVGIGTSSPTSNLQVAQSTTGSGTVSNLAGGTTVTGVGTQFTNTFKVGDTITIGGQTVAISAIASDTSMTTAAITAANTNVAYTLAGGDRFVVKGNGNVGIGTTTPGAKLEIATGSNNSGEQTLLSLKHTGQSAGDNVALLFTPASSWAGMTLPAKIVATAPAGNNVGFNFVTNNVGVANTALSILSGGNVGIGITSPTAVLHLEAGTATANTAPLKFTSGTNLTTAEAGAMEWNGTNLFITQTTGPTRKTIAYTTDIPSVGTWGALNYPTWVSGTPFVKMTAAGTFALDTNIYLTSSTGVSTFSGGTTGLTPSAATSGAITLGGTLAVANGGTGTTTGTTINGTSITYGTTNTITAAAGTLTGATLASGVTASSLTSVGTLTGLTMGGNIVLGANTLTTTNTTVVTNLNADLLDGNHYNQLPLTAVYDGGVITGVIPTASRTVNSLPNQYQRSLSGEFKQASSIAYPQGSWTGLLTFAAYTGVSTSGAGVNMQLGYDATAANTNNNLYLRTGTDSTWGGWSKVWHEGNDGTGSTLDADLLDGHDTAYFATASGYIPYTGGTSNVDLGIHNLTVDTNSLFVDSVNHRVGIGTTSPGTKLDILGDTPVNGAFTGYSGLTTNSITPLGYNPEIITRRPNVAGTGVTYRGGIGLGTGGVGIYSLNDNPSGSSYYGDIRFYTTVWNGTSSQYDNYDRMVITKTGNVGIGTTNPGAKLDVSGSLIISNNNYFQQYDSGGVARNILGMDSTGIIRMYSYSGVLFINPDTGTRTSINYNQNGNVDLVAGTSTGNVGIGTTSPGSKLDVTGNTNITGNLTLSGSQTFAIVHSAVWDHMRMLHDGSSAYLDAGGAENGLAFRVDGTSSSYPAPSYPEIMRLMPTGNVGIGTTAPLGDAGDLTLGNVSGVDGKLYLYGSTAGAVSTLRTSNGNLHIDSGAGNATYLNLYTGTGGIIFGNGASGTNANVSAAGVYTGTGLALGSGTITSGLINGQTISSAANFTGTANVAGVLTTGGITDAGFKRITNPGGASYTAGTATQNGAIAVVLPVGMGDQMIRMTIKIYEYATNESFEVHVGGYMYPTGNTWANNPFAYIVGNPGVDRRFTVRLGYTAGGKAVVYIGELASTWSYLQVNVTDVEVGYNGYSAALASGWSIGFQPTAFENVTATITNSQVGYAVSTNTADTDVRRDSSGNFSAGTITANTFSGALSGNATTATSPQNNYWDVVVAGGANDPYGALSVSAPSGANYSYIGMTRNGITGAGQGIDTNSRWWVGTASSGHTGTRTAAWAQIGSDTAIFNGTLSTGGAITPGGNLILGGNTITTTNTGLVTNLNADMLDGLQSTNFSRAFDTSGFTSSTTTAAFISELTSKGLFNYPSSTIKGTWDYAGNNDISDTGFGAFELAGTAIQTWTDGSNKTVLAIRPTTGSGGGQVLIYNDQGAGYSPGWRQIWTNTTDGSGSTLDADLLDGHDTAYFQAALTNPVTGTGTANYIPKFTGTSTMGNSLIYDDGTNIGIGTTSPQAGMKMDIRSDGSTNGSSGITAYGYNGVGGMAIRGYGYATTGTGNNYGLYGTSVGPRAAGTNVGGYFDASGAVNNYALITGTGNVGIGTATPGYPLTVNGIISASGAGGFNSATYVANARNPIWRFGNADGYGMSYFQGTTGLNGVQDTIGFHFGTATAAASLLQINQQGTVTTSGSVGVNKAIPVETLDVVGSIGLTGSLKFSTAGFQFDQVASPASVTVKKGADEIMVFDEL